MDLRLSTDAGRYLCDFIFYTGLLEYWKRGGDRSVGGGDAPVTFLHVPTGTEEREIEKGRMVAEGLIRALVESKFPAGGE